VQWDLACYLKSDKCIPLTQEQTLELMLLEDGKKSEEDDENTEGIQCVNRTFRVGDVVNVTLHGLPSSLSSSNSKKDKWAYYAMTDRPGTMNAEELVNNRREKSVTVIVFALQLGVSRTKSKGKESEIQMRRKKRRKEEKAN